MIETRWDDRTGRLYYYNSETRRSQWERPRGYQIPHHELANQPWAIYGDHVGRPCWVNTTNGSVTWSMPEAFMEAVRAGERRGVGGLNHDDYHDNHSTPSYEETEDDAAEDELLEYVLRLSLQDDGNAGSRSKGKRRAKQPANHEERHRKEKNVTANATPPVSASPGFGDAVGRCNACFDKTRVGQAPCGCRYCPNCLAAIFIQASEDGSPSPRCCGRKLPTDLAASVLERIGISATISETVPTNRKGKTENKAKARGKHKRESKDVAAEDSRVNTQTTNSVDCLVCMGSFNANDVIKTPCQHYYCRDCMKRHFLEATRNESLYPPKCCGRDIPITIANTVLNAQQQTEFANKGMEYRTKDRLYCSSRYCSAFIHPTQIHDDVGTCNRCYQRTCNFCKGVYHRGDCPNDKDTQEVLKLAQTVGWRRCFSCKVMIELNKGCNHITCGCGAEFCYTCGAVWRTCACKLWQQQNLEQAQEERHALINPYAGVLPVQGLDPVYLGQAQEERQALINPYAGVPPVQGLDPVYLGQAQEERQALIDPYAGVPPVQGLDPVYLGYPQAEPAAVWPWPGYPG